MWDDKKYKQVDRALEIAYHAEADRPERDTIISHDEIVNLIILLNTETDFDTFLAKI